MVLSSVGRVLFFAPFGGVGALVQAQGVGEGDGAVLLPHGITVEVALSIRITGVDSRTRRPGSRRWGRSRALRSRGGFRESTEAFYFFRDRGHRVGFQPAGYGKEVKPDVKGDVEDGGDSHQGHFPRMCSDELTDSVDRYHRLFPLKHFQPALELINFFLLGCESV